MIEKTRGKNYLRLSLSKAQSSLLQD